MEPDTLRQSARRISRHFQLDDRATVMLGCIACGRNTPSAEERAELVAIAGSTGDIERFIEAATSRAVQFWHQHRRMILATAERLSAEKLVCA